MRKRRLSRVGFNTKLIMDVVGAAIIVQQAPKLLSSVLPMDPMIQAVAGVGAGYLAGSVFKRPDLANASIGLGVVSFVAPLVDDLLGGGSVPLPTGAPTNAMVKSTPMVKSPAAIADYLSLNDYTNDVRSQTSAMYRDAY